METLSQAVQRYGELSGKFLRMRPPRGILELAKLSDRSGLFGRQDLPGTTELLEGETVEVAGGGSRRPNGNGWGSGG